MRKKMISADPGRICVSCQAKIDDRPNSYYCVECWLKAMGEKIREEEPLHVQK